MKIYSLFLRLGVTILIWPLFSCTHSAKPTANSTPSFPVTFEVNAPGRSQLELRFPVFWNQYRMPSVPMKKTGDKFQATVKLPQNSLIRYQYADAKLSWDNREQFEPDQEVNRMLWVTSPLAITDTTYSFGAQSVPRPIRLFGKITDRESGEPIIESIIIADGIMTFANGEGSYELELRATGEKHQVIAYLLDGSYHTQAYEVTLLDNQEINFSLEKAQAARVTLQISGSPPPYHQIRLYTSAEQTGPRFLYQNRLLTENFVVIDGEKSLDLYEGQYVDYLYTVGNPEISFEKNNGKQVIRNLVAQDGLVIQNKLGGFLGKNAVQLMVQVPDYTDSGDVIGVYGLHPSLLFLHPAGQNQWVLGLDGGLPAAGSQYRYFKSYFDWGNESKTDRTFSQQSSNDVVESWKHQSQAVTTAIVPTPTIHHSFDIFAYFYDFYSPTHATLIGSAVNRVAQKGLHGIVLSQIWGYAKLEPTPKISRFTPMTLYMPLFEITRATKIAHEKGLKVTLYPQGGVGYSGDHLYNETFWEAWLGEIKAFNLYNARCAEHAGVDAVLLQDRQPGLNMPQSYQNTFNQRMKDIIQEMRAVYHGNIITVYDHITPGAMDYWKEGDFVSDKVWDSLGLTDDASPEEIEQAAATLLDSKYKPIYQESGKPFIINQLAYFDITGAVGGATVPEDHGSNTDLNHQYPLNLEEHRRIYEAFMKAINDRDWIAGVYLFGYGFTDLPEAREIDVRAKPAEDTVSAWAKAIRNH